MALNIQNKELMDQEDMPNFTEIKKSKEQNEFIAIVLDKKKVAYISQYSITAT